MSSRAFQRYLWLTENSGEDLPDAGPVTTICPQTLSITGSTVLTCQAAAIQFQVPIAGLRNLNNDLQCRNLAEGTICAPMSCPIAVVNLRAVTDTDDTLNLPNFVSTFDNMTLAQFYAWNPYIGVDFVRQGDAVCVGSVSQPRPWNFVDTLQTSGRRLCAALRKYSHADRVLNNCVREYRP